MIKATGIVRRIDDLGRIVIPKEIRRTMGVKEGDAMEFYRDDNKIIMKVYAPGCIFCGNCNLDDLISYQNKTVCRSCIKNVGHMIK